MITNIGTYSDTNFNNIKEFYSHYVEELTKVSRYLNLEDLERASNLILETINNRGVIYSLGNGGSASIANHLQCDFGKGISTGTTLMPNIVSLSSEVSTITAIANDIGYDESYSFQLKNYLNHGDLVIAISSSGNSQNIVKALQLSKKFQGVKSILFSGFEGGSASQFADINIYFPIKNYGVVEDLHQMTMHIIAQYLRWSHIPTKQVSSTVF